MSTKSQILQHCAQCASHHVSMAKLHRTAAADCDGAHAQFHKSAAEVHTSQAEHYLAMCKSLDGETAIDTHSDERGTDSIKLKVGRTDDLEKFRILGLRDSDELMPTKVHLALPDVPRSSLVPRPGSAPIDQTEDPTDAVDQWAHSPDDLRKAILGGQ